MSLLSYRDAIAADLKASLPQAATVETHRGRFDDAAEIKRYGIKAPAVLVALLDAAATPIADGLLRCVARIGLYVITKDAPTVKRDAGGLALVDALLLRVMHSDWGADAGQAANLRAQNLYGATIDKLGIGLFAISFDQVITLEATAEAALAPFEIFHQDTDTADEHAAISQTTEMEQ